jgi:hypothetical protein
MDRAVFVYTTFPGLVEAEEAAEAIVGQRLAACGDCDYLNWPMDETKPAPTLMAGAGCVVL